MVAAHPADLAGAQRAGLRTAYVPRPLEHGPGRQHAGPAAGQTFDVVASDFIDLATKLGA
jgi:2-haloacid dehalogenase